MLFVNVLVTSGLIVAGAKTLIRQRKQKQVKWLVESKAQQIVVDPKGEYSSEILPRVPKHYLTVSVISVGLGLSSLLLYPPLGLVTVPLNVYTSMPIFESAYQSLLQDGRFHLPIIGSIVIIVALTTEHFFTASLIDWGYHYFALQIHRLRLFGQQFLATVQNKQSFISQFFHYPPEFVWVEANNVEFQIPFAELQVGDIVIVDEGQIIPVNGRVTKGEAIVDTWFMTAMSKQIRIQKEDQVMSSMIVVSGKIFVRIESK